MKSSCEVIVIKRKTMKKILSTLVLSALMLFYYY